MTYGQAILLGFVQGVAEFLPISSSGHLAVLQNFLAIGDMENHLLFDVLLHLGTLAAVFLALRGEISPLWNEGLRMLHLKKTRRGEEPDGVKRRMIWFLIAATLPLALAAAAAGADGLMVEVHDRPACALSDGAQALSCDQFDRLAGQVRELLPHACR